MGGDVEKKKKNERGEDRERRGEYALSVVWA